MQTRFNVNGDLWNDILDGVSLLSYDFTGETWTALTRTCLPPIPYLPFTEYRMDEIGNFRRAGNFKGSMPTVIKDYKARNGIAFKKKYYKPLPPRLGKLISRRGLTRAQWEALNGPHPIITALERKNEESQ